MVQLNRWRRETWTSVRFLIKRHPTVSSKRDLEEEVKQHFRVKRSKNEQEQEVGQEQGENRSLDPKENETKQVVRPKEKDQVVRPEQVVTPEKTGC